MLLFWKEIDFFLLKEGMKTLHEIFTWKYWNKNDQLSFKLYMIMQYKSGGTHLPLHALPFKKYSELFSGVHLKSYGIIFFLQSISFVDKYRIQFLVL